jgi:hypothetical protein
MRLRLRGRRRVVAVHYCRPLGVVASLTLPRPPPALLPALYETKWKGST